MDNAKYHIDAINASSTIDMLWLVALGCLPLAADIMEHTAVCYTFD